MRSRLKGHAVLLSGNRDDDIRLNIQESAAVIVAARAAKEQTISYGKDYNDTEEQSRIRSYNDED